MELQNALDEFTKLGEYDITCIIDMCLDAAIYISPKEQVTDAADGNMNQPNNILTP